MNAETKIKRNSSTAYRNLDGEGLIMNPADSMLHSLNDTGSAIWEYIAETRQVSEIVDMLMEKFNGARETAEKDVEEFLNALNEQGLIEQEG
ncbi:MAG TPA: PqqD family protein [Kiritimatiellia bacterium]|nr:PqqD family protein [Kiritimatiellia bacterium]